MRGVRPSGETEQGCIEFGEWRGPSGQACLPSQGFIPDPRLNLQGMFSLWFSCPRVTRMFYPWGFQPGTSVGIGARHLEVFEGCWEGLPWETLNP